MHSGNPALTNLERIEKYIKQYGANRYQKLRCGEIIYQFHQPYPDLTSDTGNTAVAQAEQALMEVRDFLEREKISLGKTDEAVEDAYRKLLAMITAYMQTPLKIAGPQVCYVPRSESKVIASPPAVA